MSGERILVVEDNERNMKFVRDVLQFKGYDVVEAVTGEEGVRLASEVDPDLILMDIQLPGINGYEAFEQIRNGESTRQIPIIALTASVSASDQEKILKAGFDGFEAKPVALQRLVDVVANGIATSGSTEPVARTADEASINAQSLPLVTEQSPGAPQQHGPVPTILVVDDTPQNVKLLVEILKSQQYNVVTADGGAAGLQAVETHAPDLILLDIMMPDIDGYEVCRRIREMEAHRLTPVVMVTALDGKDERVKGIESGADDFLNKPIVIPELVARVRSLLRIKSLHDQVRVQAVELEAFNQQLEGKVQEQLTKIQRMDGLKRFLPPQVAEIALTLSLIHI